MGKSTGVKQAYPQREGERKNKRVQQPQDCLAPAGPDTQGSPQAQPLCFQAALEIQLTPS